ncbi:MAG: hypothetical protein M1829_006273 [Trizodia sp. TS-e1964]|nr:MAG: hypothetical protein M1829_006273 [Trizodia sp. TS-e1964]
MPERGLGRGRGARARGDRLDSTFRGRGTRARGPKAEPSLRSRGVPPLRARGSSWTRAAGSSPEMGKHPRGALHTQDADLQRDQMLLIEPAPGADFTSHYAALKKLRERERSLAIANNLIDDPDKPKLLSEAITFVGTCPDMCPKFERIGRIVQNGIIPPDAPPGSTKQTLPDQRIMVKEFRRSAAGLDAPLPSDVRPPQVLKKTINYLIETMVGGPLPLAEVHKFVWDRTRSIRQDFTFQNITKTEDLLTAVYCYERIARFHILSLHQLSLPKIDNHEFSEQQEREQLIKTLISLLHFYDTLRARGTPCNSEAEFRAYHIITHIHVPDVENEANSLPADILGNMRVKVALKLYAAVQNVYDTKGPLAPHEAQDIAQNFYGRFFQLVKSSQVSYLMACVAEMHFNSIRRSALKAIRNAYKQQRNNTKDWTLSELMNHLNFDTEDEVEAFCYAHALEMIEAEDGETYLVFDSFPGEIKTPSPPLVQAFSVNSVERKRHARTLPEVIHGIAASKKASLFVEETPLQDRSGTATPWAGSSIIEHENTNPRLSEGVSSILPKEFPSFSNADQLLLSAPQTTNTFGDASRSAVPLIGNPFALMKPPSSPNPSDLSNPFMRPLASSATPPPFPVLSDLFSPQTPSTPSWISPENTPISFSSKSPTSSTAPFSFGHASASKQTLPTPESSIKLPASSEVQVPITSDRATLTLGVSSALNPSVAAFTPFTSTARFSASNDVNRENQIQPNIWFPPSTPSTGNILDTERSSSENPTTTLKLDVPFEPSSAGSDKISKKPSLEHQNDQALPSKPFLPPPSSKMISPNALDENSLASSLLKLNAAKSYLKARPAKSAPSTSVLASSQLPTTGVLAVATPPVNIITGTHSSSGNKAQPSLPAKPENFIPSMPQRAEEHRPAAASSTQKPQSQVPDPIPEWLAKWTFLGKEGIFEQFLQSNIERIAKRAIIQVEEENIQRAKNRDRKKAGSLDKHRRKTIIIKYINKWRIFAAKARIKRQGREARKRRREMAENLTSSKVPQPSVLEEIEVAIAKKSSKRPNSQSDNDRIALDKSEISLKKARHSSNFGEGDNFSDEPTKHKRSKTANFSSIRGAVTAQRKTDHSRTQSSSTSGHPIVASREPVLARPPIKSTTETAYFDLKAQKFMRFTNGITLREDLTKSQGEIPISPVSDGQDDSIDWSLTGRGLTNGSKNDVITRGPTRRSKSIEREEEEQFLADVRKIHEALDDGIDFFRNENKRFEKLSYSPSYS